MMSTRASFTILSLMILAVAVFGAVQLYDTVTGEHDGWDMFAEVSVTTEPLTVEPANLLTQDDRDVIEEVVEASRRFGIPWSVHVLSEEEVNSDLSSEVIAEDRFSDEPVETTEGAGDGMLMVVIVSEPDHTETTVEFVAGPNFYPVGGITPERLQYIGDVQMGDLIAEDRIGEAVIEGATWVQWTQLFEPTPNGPETKFESGLQSLLAPVGDFALAGVTVIVVAATAFVVFSDWRGTGTAPTRKLDGITAAAALQGRVDRPVIAGVILDAIDRGTLAVTSGTVATVPASRVEAHASQWDASIEEAVSDLHERGQEPTLESLADYLGSSPLLRERIEDHLAAHGVYHPKAAKRTLGLRWIAAAGFSLGLIGFVLAVLAESTSTLVFGIALTVISLIVLIWNEDRSWTTRAGRRAVADWLEQHSRSNDRERLLYEAVMSFDDVDLTRTNQSPLRGETREIIPALRA